MLTSCYLSVLCCACKAQSARFGFLPHAVVIPRTFDAQGDVDEIETVEFDAESAPLLYGVCEVRSSAYLDANTSDHPIPSAMCVRSE